MKMYHLNQDSILKIKVIQIYKKRFLTSGIFGKIPAKVLKESSNICNAVLRYIWNFEMLEKQNFPRTTC